MLDLVIRGNRVVTPQGVGAFDLAIEGEKIVAVARAGTFGPQTTQRLIDAGDGIVMPGGIDPHVHCSWPVPSGPGGTPGLSEPPSVVSRAALYGGTTTLIDFAQRKVGTSIPDTLKQRDQEWIGQCYCDYSYHILLEGSLEPEIFGQIEEAIRAGYPTVKLFTTNVRPVRTGRMVDFGDIWEVFQAVASAGGMCVMHSEDNDIVMHMYDRLFREGRAGFENMAEVHNALSEDLSFRRVIRLAESVPGMAIYFMHVSAETGVEAIREARARGSAVYGETLHQYLMYTAEDYKRPNGQMYHTYPSLKSAADQAALWAGTADGAINTVATDEVCCTLAVKLRGNRIDDTTGGNSGVEPRLAVMYTEMVERRGYSLQKFVDLTSTNAAKIMGLYPRKGALIVDSDADITILDTSRRLTVSKEMLHETDYSPWEGHEVHAWPSMTVLRGKVKVENGRLLGDPSDGEYLYRKISDEIRHGPSL
jgi:dihydropyrimidinase